MRLLVDSNVLSEPMRPAPDPKVVEWLRRHERDLSVNPIIVGEIRFGIHLLPEGKRRTQLERWFADGVAGIVCLPLDARTGMRWAKLLADLRRTGRAMPVKDSLIAATALVHDLTVATRNGRDFAAAGVEIVDPFA